MFNKVILVGRLTADPELKRTQSGKFFSNFRISVDRRYKDSSGIRQTDFIGCIVWSQGAEFVYGNFRKGDPIGIDGSIQTRNYEDQQGNKRTAVEVLVEHVFFAGRIAKAGETVLDTAMDSGWESPI